MLKSISILPLLIPLLGSIPLVYPYPYPHSPHLFTRNIVEKPRSDAYDFVICGGGAGGAVLASRLSANPDFSVLLIEAGTSGDEVRDRVDYPQGAYYSTFVGTEYDWGYSTVPQGNVGDQQLKWPRGKMLGGSTAINGLYMTRPHRDDLEAWKALWASEDSSGSDNWGWDTLSAALIKSETFHPPTDELAEATGLSWVDEYHGSEGPVHYAFPAVARPVMGSWIESMAGIGVSPRDDPASGNNEGSYINTICENPFNLTRSYSRSAYLDPLPPRDNLDILSGFHVTNIVFDSNSPPTATAVEYKASVDDVTSSVKVNKEVILAAGTVGSPQILMVSGVGPKDIVEGAGVTSVHDLAGVGHHLQDHIKAAVTFAASEDTTGSIHSSESPESQTPEFRSYVSSAASYVNLTTLFGDGGAVDVVTTAAEGKDAASQTVPSGSPEVVEGFKAIYDTHIALMGQNVPQIEMLLTDMFPGVVIVQAALQHPLSSGRVYINSSSVFDSAVIDPQYLTHETDRVILREGMKLARKVGETEPLKSFTTEETSPGPDVQSDEDWDAFITQAAGTEYHPCGTSAMLPLSQGGVVDASLKVYGLDNVRVIDASVIPFSLSTHTMSITYALAEQGATIVAAQHGASSDNSNSGDNNDGSEDQDNSDDDNFATRLSPQHLISSLSLIALLHALL